MLYRLDGSNVDGFMGMDHSVLSLGDSTRVARTRLSVGESVEDPSQGDGKVRTQRGGHDGQECCSWPVSISHRPTWTRVLQK